MAKSANNGRLIYGGSFNPLHIGHMRIALESCAHLREYVATLEFMPSAVPPHKPLTGMLPFWLRAEMIQAAIKNFPLFGCNDIESKRAEPSYTYETLRSLGCAEELYFILGSQDFALLPDWWHGLRLPEACNLVIVPREAYDLGKFIAQCNALWPEIDKKTHREAWDDCPEDEISWLETPWGTKIYFLNIAYIDISASRIRKLWLRNRPIDYLVPEPVQKILKRESQAVSHCWRENSDLCSR